MPTRAALRLGEVRMMTDPNRGQSTPSSPEPAHRTSRLRHCSRHHQQSQPQRPSRTDSESSQGYPVRESSASHHRNTQRRHRHRHHHGVSGDNQPYKHSHHRSKAHYSTSRSPLRGRRRHSSRHRKHEPSSGTHDNRKRNWRKRPSSHDRGLLDVLTELVGHGEHGPDVAALAQLADTFGELIMQGLVHKLVVELENGLLEKMLVDYLKDLIRNSVRRGLGKGARKTAGRGKRDRDGDDEQDWKKALLKKAFMTVAKSLTETER